MLSPFPNDGVSHFWGRKFLTGCFGVNRFGVMEADPLIVQAQARLIERAEEIIVLADASKLRQQSSMIVTSLDRVSTLVTDDGARPQELELFEAAGVKVIVVNVAAQDDVRSATG